MKPILKGVVVLVIMMISLTPAVQAQDESKYDGVWYIDAAYLVLNVADGTVEVFSPGQNGCNPVMEVQLIGDKVLQNDELLFVLELAEDGNNMLIYQEGEVFAEAQKVGSLEEACLINIPVTSVETITSVADLETLVSEVFEQTNIPGMAVAVVGPQGVIWSAGYGFANVEEELPVTADTPFMLASVTKVFTGTSLMMAWEAEGFDLDAPVNDWLPFQVDNPRTESEEITLRHLATHTSGLLDNWEYYLAVYTEQGDSPIALGDFLEGYLTPGGEWYDADANFADWMPGTTFKYSNVGAALAGYTFEMIIGTPLDDYADEHLFGPLGMTNTHWHLADFPDTSVIAVPYEADGTALEHYGYPTWPDGQLRSSANDVGRFLAALLNNGELEGVRILKPETIDSMLQPQLPDVAPQQGWFWVLGETGEVGHSGGDPGVSTNIAFSRDLDLGLILLTNSDSGEMGLVWGALAGPIFEAADVLNGE